MTAFIFPGQGSQEPGMGRALYEAHAEAREVFGTGSRVTGRDLAALCFENDAGTLSRTVNAQLAVFTVSMAAYAVRKGETEPPAALAGFSLGECSALCAAGCLSLEDGFRLVQKRAEAMQEACEDGNGAMSALLCNAPLQLYYEADGGGHNSPSQPHCGPAGAERDSRRHAAAWAVAVNFNCPGQTVVAGTPEGVAVLEERCRAAGGRVSRLALSGAFHTKAMAGAGAALRVFAGTLSFRPPAVPLYTNLSGEILSPGADIPRHLEAHMTNPVLWQKCVENMIAAGMTRFIETGHGSSLAKLIRRIDRGAEVL
ncbi:MAG: ACP S-malonyltransferase [Oscillospiraceae bacterium]|jgi:[acyl-carrier-protein] S-malonyltransferase|nr:ACP S-malonyltransferase [Oscillospiraceae bacterium]